MLALSPSIARSAFSDPNASTRIAPVSRSNDGKMKIHEDLKETSTERQMRERKMALNRLFDAIALQPVVTASGAGGTKPTQSKRGMLESYEATQLKKKKKKAKGGEEEPEEDDEADALNSMQLNMVCESCETGEESMQLTRPDSQTRRQQRTMLICPRQNPPTRSSSHFAHVRRPTHSVALRPLTVFYYRSKASSQVDDINGDRRRSRSRGQFHAPSVGGVSSSFDSRLLE